MYTDIIQRTASAYRTAAVYNNIIGSGVLTSISSRQRSVYYVAVFLLLV